MRSAFRIYCPPCDLVILYRIFIRKSWISVLLLIGFNLQVDKISEIGAPLKERYHERGAGISRCLKLSMTDGVQCVVGIKYQPISTLRNLFRASMKVCE